MTSVQAEAAGWVARLEGDTLPADQRAKFDDWIGRSPSHAAAYEDALRTWRDLAAMRSDEHYRALLGQPTLRERMISALHAPRWLAVALSTTAAVAIAWLAFSFDMLPFLYRSTQVATQIAEVRELTLADGSSIVLGAGSQLDFDVTRQTRRASVADGDAFFSVTHDPARPFTVAIGTLRIRVIGTQFEIRRRGDAVTVAVAEGIVEVSRSDASGAPVRLRRGEALTARRGEDAQVREIEAADIGAWRSGRLVYDNAALRDVVADANRYSRTRIVIGDPQLADLRLTTSFRTSQVDGMVETLQGALPVVVERQPNGDILLQARR